MTFHFRSRFCPRHSSFSLSSSQAVLLPLSSFSLSLSPPLSLFSSFSHSLLLFLASLLAFFLVTGGRGDFSFLSSLLALFFSSLPLSSPLFIARGRNRFSLSHDLSLFFSSFSHSLLLFLAFFLARASLSLSLSRDGNFRREERFLFLPSSLLSLTLSFSSSLSSSPAGLSLSHDGNFRREERYLFLSSFSFSEIISFFLPLFLLSVSPSPLLEGNKDDFCREDEVNPQKIYEKKTKIAFKRQIYEQEINDSPDAENDDDQESASVFSTTRTAPERIPRLAFRSRKSFLRLYDIKDLDPSSGTKN